MTRFALAFLLLGSFSGPLFAQGSLLLVGGGSENYNDWSDAPYRWLVTHAPNRKIAVLHYSDTTTWFSGYFPWLSPCTVSNRQITSVTQANDSATYRFILQHDGIFLRGGDQNLYVQRWRGTLTETAIREVFQRGGVVGGTSAGEMVLGDVDYTAGNSDNGALLRSPTNGITLVDDFLRLAPGALAESHTNERGRLGRLPVFLARIRESFGRQIMGIGVDVNTALAIGIDGTSEAMGGSAVSFLRWSAETSPVIESGRPFSLRNMQFDQVLPGWKINLQSGAIQPLPSATPFHPKTVLTPPGVVILDGSGNSADWFAAAGSLKRLQGALPQPTDTVGIFSSGSSPASATSIAATLASWGVASRIFWLADNLKGDAELAASVTRCGAFLFVNCVPDTLSRVLDSSTTMGVAFTSKVGAAAPLLFLGEDVMLAGEKGIGELTSSQYSAYYGTLTHTPGLNLIRGVQAVPRLYQKPDNTVGYDYSENRVMGMFWAMGRLQLPLGLLIDGGTHLLFRAGRIEVEGVTTTRTPVLLFDARSAGWTDFPVFHRPGRPNAVQNAALTGAQLHIIRPGDALDLVTGVGETGTLPSGEFRLEPGFPNPFNPATTIRFTIPAQGRVSIRVYDLLGREIALILDSHVNPGVHDVSWNAAGHASGAYVLRGTCESNGRTTSRTEKLLLIR